MSEKFYAKILTRSERDRSNDRLEITLCNASGECRTISLGANVIAALSSLLEDRSSGKASDVTRVPDSFAVGHGRHEPFVMMRFEDEPAYGLTAELALGLGEALIEEAETLAARVKYPVRQ